MLFRTKNYNRQTFHGRLRQTDINLIETDLFTFVFRLDESYKALEKIYSYLPGH